jgi:hypothetical protein
VHTQWAVLLLFEALHRAAIVDIMLGLTLLAPGAPGVEGNSPAPPQSSRRPSTPCPWPSSP